MRKAIITFDVFEKWGIDAIGDEDGAEHTQQERGRESTQGGAHSM